MSTLIGERSMAAWPQLAQVVDRARGATPLPVAIAYPCDGSSLQAALAVSRERLITQILVSPRARIREAAITAGIDVEQFSVIHCADDPRVAARTATQFCRDGKAAALMKGSLHTDELLAAAFCRPWRPSIRRFRPRSMRPHCARWRIASRSRVRSSMGPWLLTTPFPNRRRRTRESTLQLRVMRTSCCYPIWRPET